MNDDDIEREVWAAFRAMAARVPERDRMHHFRLEAHSDDNDAINLHLAKAHGTVVRGPDWKQARRRIFNELAAMGLIVPGEISQAVDWNAEFGYFSFSPRGLRYFQNQVDLGEPGPLRAVLEPLRSRYAAVVTDGTLALLLEAQRCVRSSCHRAAIILIGLASEDACSALLDVLARYPNQDAKNGDWKIVVSEPVFSKRWGAAVRLVRKIKDGLRQAGRGQDWWRPLDPIPEWLLPLGEAVRLARNEAAHVADRDFAPGEVFVLLAAIPTQLEMVAALAQFLAAPPGGVALPSA